MEPVTTHLTESVSKGLFSFILKKVPSYFRTYFRKIWNLLKRPKLEIKLVQNYVVFTSQEGKEHHLNYPCLLIVNKSQQIYQFNPDKLQINKASYKIVLQQDRNFSKLNLASKTPWKDCKNEIYLLYQSNWLNICQNNYLFELGAHRKFIFPLKLIKEGIHVLTNFKSNSFLFFEKNKVNITIELNHKIYEYGINRKKAYELYLNYLSFYTETNH